MTTVPDDVYFNWLQAKLADTMRQASEHERLAAHHNAEAEKLQTLAENIEETIKGLFGNTSQSLKVVGEPNEASLNGSTADVGEVVKEEENQCEAVATLDKQDNNQNEPSEVEPNDEDESFVDSRSAKEMKKQPYHNMSYIEAATTELTNYPEGRTVDELVLEIFDIQTEEEFNRAKASFSVEIRRGLVEGKLYVDPHTANKRLKRYLLPNQQEQGMATLSFGIDNKPNSFNSNKNEVQGSYA